MKSPSVSDRVVKVRAYLTDEVFGYEHWRAAQCSAPNVPSARYAVLILCDTESDRDDQIAQLAVSGRSQETAEPPHHCQPSDYVAMMTWLAQVEAGEMSCRDVDWRTKAGVLHRMLAYATRCSDRGVDAFLAAYAAESPRGPQETAEPASGCAQFTSELQDCGCRTCDQHVHDYVALAEEHAGLQAELEAASRLQQGVPPPESEDIDWDELHTGDDEHIDLLSGAINLIEETIDGNEAIEDVKEGLESARDDLNEFSQHYIALRRQKGLPGVPHEPEKERP